jgi:hypothetical protein
MIPKKIFEPPPMSHLTSKLLVPYVHVPYWSAYVASLSAYTWCEPVFLLANIQGLDIYGTAGRFSSTSLAPVNKYLRYYTRSYYLYRYVRSSITLIFGELRSSDDGRTLSVIFTVQKRLSNLNETRVRVLFET